jgi:uncharacterized protein (DUF305 family)
MRAFLAFAAGVAAAAALAASPEPTSPWCRSARDAAGTVPDSFPAQVAAAMEKMMSGMEVAPSGDADRDFAALMIPHHQGAIEMAQAELRYGRNEQLRRIAQEVVVEQQQEIAAMRLALGEPVSPAP